MGRRAAVCLSIGVAGVLLLWPSTAGVAAPARAAALSIGPITAVFSEPDRATTYSVPDVTDDPGAKLSNQWSLTLQKVDPAAGVDLACNNRGVLGGTDTTFVWHHGNAGDPDHDDGCNHNISGRYGHQGLIGVVVTDGRGNRCEATYKGTNSSTATSVQDGVASTPVCTNAALNPPETKRRCACLSLTARIVPSSLRLVDSNRDRTTLKFTLHWTLSCKPGDTGCLADIHIYPPQEKIDGKKYSTEFTRGQGPHVHLFCKAPCGEIVDGGVALTLEDEPGRELGPLLRASESIPIVIERHCYSGGKFNRPRLELTIAFDRDGDIDLKKSKLR